jgi:hypothetical protein
MDDADYAARAQGKALLTLRTLCLVHDSSNVSVSGAGLMCAAVAESAPAAGSVTRLVVTAPPPSHHTVFDELLSELNPLQYLPVIGTIYRAVTGDTIPEEARTVGSLVVSGLTGGAMGIAMNVATLAVEKLTGIDPDKIGQSVLAEIGLGGRQRSAAASRPTTAAVSKPVAAAAVASAEAPVRGWTPTQLAAYGVGRTAAGTLKRGATVGCDVLNELELARVSHTPALPT